MSSDKRSTPLVFAPLLNEDMLPEERKKVVRKNQKSCHRSRHVLRRYFKVRELRASERLK